MCNHDYRVLETRPVNGGLITRRRYECRVCKARYTSYEFPVIPETSDMVVSMLRAVKTLASSFVADNATRSVG